MVREVKGFGRQKSYLDQYGDSEYSQAFPAKSRNFLVGRRYPVRRNRPQDRGGRAHRAHRGREDLHHADLRIRNDRHRQR